MKFNFYSLSLQLRVLIGIFLSVLSAYFVYICLSFIGALLFSLSIEEYFIQVQTATTFLISKSFVQYILFNQSISIFLVPSIIMTKVINPRIFNYLGLNFLPSGFFIFIIIQLIILNIPGLNFWSSLNTEFINLFVQKNSKIYLLYQQSLKISDFLLKSTSYKDLGLNMIFMAFIPALCEEFFFRGMLQKYVSQSIKNTHVSILIVSIIFSVMHADMYNFFPRLVMGVIFGYLYEYKKNLWIPIIAHFTHNAMVVLIFFAIEKGWMITNFKTIGEYGNSVIFGIVSIIIVVVFIKLMLDKYLESQDL